MFAVAPMMDWTDRHCRMFHRTLTRRALLYTEMLTADAVIHGVRDRLLGFSPQEKPAALQLGGCDPDRLGEAARIGAEFGYDEVNLNVGCPSDRVQAGRFGACLMREPQLVADCALQMQVRSGLPVTVKHRLGVDDQNPQETLSPFIDAVAQAGVRTFIVHARKAILKGLSPRENRVAPPLDYAIVRSLKQRRPDLTIILNGGLMSAEHARNEMSGLDGVMLGRAAYHTPATLMEVDSLFYGVENPYSNKIEALEAYLPYVAAQLQQGIGLHAMTRHILGLFHGRPGGRAFRRILSQGAPRRGAGLEVLIEALDAVRREHAMGAGAA
jgi:tRNA-dihydrouridine synthase A